MKSFPRYPDYRDSGVKWLREIPAHWEVRRLKTIADVQLSSVDKKTVAGQLAVRLCNYTDVYYRDEIRGSDVPGFMKATARESEVRCFGLRKGDVLITKDSETPNDIAVPAIVAEDLPGVVCGYHLALVRPNPTLCNGRFLGRAIGAAGPRDQYRIQANGVTRFGLTRGAIRRSVTPFPPLSEQRAIADFLDHQTNAIDRALRGKERLLDLLEEMRTALISHAVTRGLDPDAPMRESGVEWFGKIPAHWEVRRLKTIANVQLSSVNKKTVAGQSSVRLCNYTDVYYSNKIRASDVADFMKATARKSEIKRFELRKGDMLITKDSETPDDIAVPAVVAEDLPGVVCGYHLAMLRPNPLVCDGRFLSRAIGAAGPRDQYRVLANGVTRFGLTLGAIGRSVIPLPPLPEQRAIADYLGRKTGQIDALVANTRELIERLHEYHAAVISAAVTGQIDVRLDEARN